MEIIRLIPLLGFLLLCFQIGTQAFILSRKGTLLSVGKKQSSKVIRTTLLTTFFVVFFNELFYKAGLIRFSILPDALKPLLTGKVILAISGTALVLLANVIMFFALRELNHSLRFGLNKGNLGKLVTSGIFAHSRNPFFLAINCLFIGISLIFPTPFFIAISLLTLISIHFFILKEERFMKNNYGEEYENYTKKVRRYF